MNFGLLTSVRYIVLPQAWRVILPPAFSFFVMFIKDTALASQIGVVELTFAAKVLNNKGFSAALVFGDNPRCLFRDFLSVGTRLGANWRPDLPHLDIAGLEASYGAVPVLSGIDLSVAKGDVIGLMGPSGSGKSTILRASLG